MKKVPLLEVKQHNDVFLAAKVDPRELVMLADDIQVGTTQDAQRPLEKKHLLEIASFVAQNGDLPSSVIISTKKNSSGHCLRRVSESVTVLHENGSQEKNLQHYMLFPESKEEFEQYKGTIDIIDGQHRIFSFHKDFRSPDLKDDVPYEMLVSIYELPVLSKRRMLFMTTNEKQKAVSGNLLLWLRKKLDLLSDQEKTYYPLVESLSLENCSPLKGRIIMNAEKITKGYKAKELIKILGKTFPSTMLIGSAPATDTQKFDAICKYLHGWESHYGLSFQSPGRETMTKISGLRYILWLFPTFWEIAISQKEKWDDNFFDKIIADFETAIGQNSLFKNSINFRGEGATSTAVSQHVDIYKAWKATQTSDSFNPLG